MSYASLKPWVQQFVDAYVTNAHQPNPTAAFRAVKPESKRPDVGASKLMARADVQAAIHERLVRRREASELDEKWVLDRLRSVAERCMQTEPVFDRKGDPVLTKTPDGKLAEAYTFDAAGANRALELIGKHFAMFTDNLNVRETPPAEEMSDDELLAIARTGTHVGATH